LGDARDLVPGRIGVALAEAAKGRPNVVDLFSGELVGSGTFTDRSPELEVGESL
jgi:hypothetical protein